MGYLAKKVQLPEAEIARDFEFRRSFLRKAAERIDLFGIDACISERRAYRNAGQLKFGFGQAFCKAGLADADNRGPILEGAGAHGVTCSVVTPP
ncbi:hypothetical protein SmB9_10380 [Sphingosinicella microcystinivorans]|uniref:Uncharacterized protein n=1 Tax=Sphingosinicella microcystinivorans TaxID=335406 RepID=A0AAD1D445_SPHMI|nr:hypothetical protein SmB9_10380 [Sphingosinicella microcystinivorans]